MPVYGQLPLQGQRRANAVFESCFLQLPHQPVVEQWRYTTDEHVLVEIKFHRQRESIAKPIEGRVSGLVLEKERGDAAPELVPRDDALDRVPCLVLHDNRCGRSAQVRSVKAHVENRGGDDQVERDGNRLRARPMVVTGRSVPPGQEQNRGEQEQ